MKKIFLKDFEKWKNLNKENGFSLFDYVFHLFKSRNVNSDAFFALFELIWPTYFEHEGYFFLKENFSEIRLKELQLEKHKNVEYWINLLLIDPYFENEENSNERAASLVGLLAETWGIKLKKDFPDVEFIVEQICDEIDGDYGITFYQVR